MEANPDSKVGGLNHSDIIQTSSGVIPEVAFEAGVASENLRDSGFISAAFELLKKESLFSPLPLLVFAGFFILYVRC